MCTNVLRRNIRRIIIYATDKRSTQLSATSSLKISIRNMSSNTMDQNLRDNAKSLETDSFEEDYAFPFMGEKDRFKGITVNSKKEKCNHLVFPAKVQASLDLWKKNGIRGVWFKVALEDSNWIPVLVENGFTFHHAKPKYVTLCKWLPETEINNVPQYAHTMIGVGAIVVNSSDEVLVVREKYFAEIPHWKLPGGYVEPGEDLAEAAIREVLEETNIEAEFQFLVTFRHTHGVQFNCSDFYFIVALKPKSEQINMCTREIAACQWMKLDDYLSSSYVHETNKFFVQKYLECKKSGRVVSCEYTIHPFLRRKQSLYSIDSDMTKYFPDDEEKR